MAWSGELTTTEAAQFAGVSRQHLVDLCDRGVLPHRKVGTHRRLRVEDVTSYLGSPCAGIPTLTRKERISLAIHCFVAAELLKHEARTRAHALRNLETMRQANRDGAATEYLDEWERLLNGPTEHILETLTSLSHRARDLRNVTPFAGVISDARRRGLIETIK
ncbi:MAG: helix-turn-helix domain-containing protein [Acidimicrobiia bacterium]|nr:helix-turn-helix domain-containing protein [Acidimicrobiia bacterium]